LGHLCRRDSLGFEPAKKLGQIVAHEIEAGPEERLPRVWSSAITILMSGPPHILLCCIA
jgi:hypothetical protein